MQPTQSQELYIDLIGVRDLPPLLDRQSEAALSAAVYIPPNTHIDFSGSLISRLVDAHQALVDEIDATMRSFSGPCMIGGSQALSAAFRFYERTDRRRAAIMDEGFPHPEGVAERVAGYSMGYPTAPPGFKDLKDPHEWLKPPSDHFDDRTGFEWQIMDAISPMRLAAGALWEATSLASKIGLCDRPVDAYEEMLRPLAGDWAGLRRCAEVWRNIAEHCRDLDLNIRSNVAAVPQVWRGNAADVAEEFLILAGEAIFSISYDIDNVAITYDFNADKVYEFGQALAELFSALGDLLVALIVELSAAAASVETVIGPLIFGGAAVYDLYEVFRVLKSAWEITAAIEATVEALKGGLTGSQHAIEAKPMPVPPPAPVLPGR